MYPLHYYDLMKRVVTGHINRYLHLRKAIQLHFLKPNQFVNVFLNIQSPFIHSYHPFEISINLRWREYTMYFENIKTINVYVR